MKIAICLGVTAALSLACAAAADDGTTRGASHHRGHGTRADANGDGRITLQESQAALRDRLMRLDGNHDGKVTRAEMDARRGELEARHARRGADAFARLDTDHDGQLSQSEFAAGRDALHEHRRDHDGRGHRGPRPHGDPGERFDRLDADHDGAVSAAEIDAAAAERFVVADANHDGALTADEQRQAHRERRGHGA